MVDQHGEFDDDNHPIFIKPKGDWNTKKGFMGLSPPGESALAKRRAKMSSRSREICITVQQSGDAQLLLL